MRKTVLSVILFAFCSAIGGAQTLTELADKEKERRKSNAEAGKTAVAELDGGPLTAKQRRYVAEAADRKAQSAPVKKIYDEVEKLQRALAATEMEYKIEQSECRSDAHRLQLSPSSDEVSSCRKARRMGEKRRADEQRIRELKKEARELPVKMESMRKN